jgi:Zn-dependent protease with chaperone function
LPAQWQVRFIFGATLALIARLAALLPGFYLYRVERIMGLSVELTRVWVLFWIGHTLLAMIVAGLIAALVLWLVARTHQWYVYTIVAILGVSIGWAYASPYFELAGTIGMRPAQGALGDRLRDTLAHAGLPNVPVYVVASRTSPLGEALVPGLGGSRRVVLTDTLIAGSTPAEIAYAVADQIGHVIHADPLFVALIEGGIIIIFSALAVVIADRIRFRRDDDSLSRLALVGALLAVVYLVAVPVRNAALRSYDFDADRYAVSLTGDKAAAIRAIVRNADQRMQEVCPELFASLFLTAHPSPGARIEEISGVPPGCP